MTLPNYGVYSATKAAVEQLTGVFAKEVGAPGIRVNYFDPDPRNTDLFLDCKVVQYPNHYN
ncbi:SDR family oxidoreductase [Microcoleus vaginatus]|uniref:SDR family oxidoreductase n=1 Tax=Microcoleus vaginatus TaxID=119532 RepID=UPI000586D217